MIPSCTAIGLKNHYNILLKNGEGSGTLISVDQGFLAKTLFRFSAVVVVAAAAAAKITPGRRPGPFPHSAEEGEYPKSGKETQWGPESENEEASQEEEEIQGQEAEDEPEMEQEQEGEDREPSQEDPSDQVCITDTCCTQIRTAYFGFCVNND